MKRPFIIIALTVLLFALIACGTFRKIPTATVQQRDSTHTEVREKTVHVRDTVYFEIPAQEAERTTNDTTSFLENDYAESNARINPDGSLFHDLKTKPQDKPVPTEKEIVYRDSIVYKDKYVEVPVPVEKKLSWWEQTCIKWFPYSIGALLLSLVVIFRKPMLTLIRRFI